MSTNPEPSSLDSPQSSAELRRQITEALLAVERAESELERVAAVRTVRELAEALEFRAIRHARDARTSWSKIGGVYGLTKQGAQQRFGQRS